MDYSTVIAVAELEQSKAVYVPKRLEDRQVQSLFEKVCLYAKPGDKFVIFSSKGLDVKLIEWFESRRLNVRLFGMLD